MNPSIRVFGHVLGTASRCLPVLTGASRTARGCVRYARHNSPVGGSAGDRLVFAGPRTDRLRCSESPAGVAQQAEQPSCKRQVSGSNPLTGSQVREGSTLSYTSVRGTFRGTNVTGRIYPDVMPRVAKGHIEQLPSGSFRVSVYAGIDPLTRRATPPQVHGQDRAAGAHRARQAAQGSVRRPHARVRRDRGDAHGRVRGGRGVGRVHAADQRGVHPPYDQACPGAYEGAEGARPHPRQAVRGAQALRRPVLHGQAIHRAPQRPGADDQPP